MRKFVACRCIFYGNSFRLPQQCNVFIAAGVCRVEDCQITSQSGGGMCVCLSACLYFSALHIQSVKNHMFWSLITQRDNLTSVVPQHI